MDRRNRTPERLVALFLLGVLALLPPVLLVFNRPERVLGVPILYLYVLGAWATIIALAAVVTRSIDTDAPTERPGAEKGDAAVKGPRDA